jgi:hypothetical protein
MARPNRKVIVNRFVVIVNFPREHACRAAAHPLSNRPADVNIRQVQDTTLPCMKKVSTLLRQLPRLKRRTGYPMTHKHPLTATALSQRATNLTNAPAHSIRYGGLAS